MRHDLAYQIAEEQGRIYGGVEESRIRALSDLILLRNAAALDPDPSRWHPPAPDAQAAERARQEMFGSLVGAPSEPDPPWMTSPDAGWPQGGKSRMNEAQLVEEVDERSKEWFRVHGSPAATGAASTPPSGHPSHVRESRPSEFFLGAPDREGPLRGGPGTPVASAPGSWIDVTSIKNKLPWVREFLAGTWEGFRDALPNLLKSLRDHPVMTSLVMAGVILIAAKFAGVALAGAVLLTAYQLWQARNDPRQLGRIVGENGFFIGAGKVFGSLLKGLSKLKGRWGNPPAIAAVEGTAGRAASAEAGVAEGAVSEVASRPPRVELPVLNNPLCFVAGTLVRTASGDRPIETIRPGDEVLTWSPSSHRVVSRRTSSPFSAALLALPAAAVALHSAAIIPSPTTFDRNGQARSTRADRAPGHDDLIRIGDRLWRVLTTTDGGARLELQETDLAMSRVPVVFRRRAPSVLTLRAEQADGHVTTVTGTAEHPFYVPSLARWVRMGELRAGMGVATSSGRDARVLDLRKDSRARLVYNFEVSATHNYFVGDSSNDASLLVHNQCTGDNIVDAVRALEKATGANQASSFTAAIEAVNATLDDASNIARKIEAAAAARLKDLDELNGIIRGANRSADALRKLAASLEATQPAQAGILRNQAAQLEKLAKDTGDVLSRVPPATFHTTVSPQMENKILRGERISNASSPGGMSNELRGGHSAELLNDPMYEIEILQRNPDGTLSVKMVTQYPDGKLSKIKPSTLAPVTWSGPKIIETTKIVGDSIPVAKRTRDGAQLYRQVIDGVEWEVIKDALGNVTSSYPTGGNPTRNF